MSNERPIGALWVKEGTKGQYFSGVLEDADGNKTPIVAFANSYKTNANHPDFKIFLARKPGAAGGQPHAQAAPAGQDAPPPRTDADEMIQVEDIKPEDVPF